MKRFRQRLINLLCLLLVPQFFASCANSVFAADEFEIDSTVTYSVSQNGRTDTQHEISLTNKTIDVYATDYALSLASTRVDKVWAKDGISELFPTVSTTGNATTISLKFKQMSLGINQQLHFSIGFSDQDIAQKIGKVWEINIPRPENIFDYRTYVVKLVIPSSFGKPVQMLPEPSSVVSGTEQTIYLFQQNQLSNTGITAIFGEKQVFAFDLRYALENSSPVTENLEIALPPNTAYQTVVYDAITPTPQNIKLDGDGNWLATYRLKSKQKIEVHAAGKVVIYINPQNGFLSQGNPQDYLDSAVPWPVDNPEIRSLANKLKTPENIYNYIVKNFQYSYNRVEEGGKRLGAENALLYPDQATCMEFTDVFISLARAAGIPARELNGFAYTQNPDLRPLSLRLDLLHAWPEYYDFSKQVWIPIDPTWGNTTQGIDYFSRFDLNHFVFAVHGLDAQKPQPAGFYRTVSFSGKDISVNPEDIDPKLVTNLNLQLNLPEKLTAGFPAVGTLTVTNSGNSAVYGKTVSISSPQFAILSPANYQIPAILPYTTLTLPLKFRAKELTKSQLGNIKISLDEQRIEKNITIVSFISQIPQALLALALGTGLAAISHHTGSLLLSLRRK